MSLIEIASTLLQQVWRPKAFRLFVIHGTDHVLATVLQEPVDFGQGAPYKWVLSAATLVPWPLNRFERSPLMERRLVAPLITLLLIGSFTYAVLYNPSASASVKELNVIVEPKEMKY